MVAVGSLECDFLQVAVAKVWNDICGIHHDQSAREIDDAGSYHQTLAQVK